MISAFPGVFPRPVDLTVNTPRIAVAVAGFVERVRHRASHEILGAAEHFVTGLGRCHNARTLVRLLQDLVIPCSGSSPVSAT